MTLVFTHDLVTESRQRVDLCLVWALGLHRLGHQPHRRGAHGLVRGVAGQLLEVEVHLDLAVTARLLGDILQSEKLETFAMTSDDDLGVHHPLSLRDDDHQGLLPHPLRHWQNKVGNKLLKWNGSAVLMLDC